jgi:hypothetical protein
MDTECGKRDKGGKRRNTSVLRLVVAMMAMTQ